VSIFMKFLLIVSLLLTACFLGGGPYKSEPRITDKDSKPITKVWDFVDVYKWRASQWYRPNDDMYTPGSIIESGDYACILDFPDISQPRPGHNYVCIKGWRLGQRRGP